MTALTRYHKQKTPLYERGFLFGAPGEIRTPDQVVRSHLLYPAELRVRGGRHYIEKLRLILLCRLGTADIDTHVRSSNINTGWQANSGINGTALSGCNGRHVDLA